MMVAILRYPFGAGEMPAVGTPPAPRPCGPAAGPNLLASLRLQTLHVQNRAAGRPRSPTEPGSPLAWGLGTQPRGAGSRPFQAAGPSLIDSDPVTKCSGRWWWSLASTGRTTCRSPGSVTTSWTPRRPCRPATEAGERLRRGAPTSPHRGAASQLPQVPALRAQETLGTRPSVGRGGRRSCGRAACPKTRRRRGGPGRRGSQAAVLIKSGGTVVPSAVPLSLSISAKDIVRSGPGWKAGRHPAAPVRPLGLWCSHPHVGNYITFLVTFLIKISN